MATGRAIATIAGGADSKRTPAGWLRDAPFDLFFILGLAVIAMAGGFAVSANPGLWGVLLVPYLWLIGYPHLVSTYSQTAFDRTSYQQYRFLNVELPLLIMAAVAAVALTAGAWAVITVYFYWQWFHFARQSYGVARFYARGSGGRAPDERLTHWLIYLIPALGILYRSWQAPETYLGSALWVIPVPGVAVAAVGAVSAAMLGLWLLRRIDDFIRGELAVPYTLYLISHFAMFITGYLLIENVNYGWFALSIWHSAQYILFVWLINRKRFGEGDAKHPLLSELSRPGRALRYFAVVLGLSSVLFLIVRSAAEFAESNLLPLTLIVFMAINFHHYTVDAIIWRKGGRKKAGMG